MTHLVIASARRLLAEALVSVVVREIPTVSSGDVCVDEASLRAVLDRRAGNILVFDLDAPVADVRALGSLTGDSEVRRRRCAFYDEFTARHAEAAFELSVTALFPISAPLQQITGAVTEQGRALSATRSRGISRKEMARLRLLSDRELEVLQLMASGRTTKVIAHLLGITAHTVNTHRRRIFQKLEVQSQGQAVTMAVAAGVVAAEIN